MPRKKQEATWVTCKEAAKILSENSGHVVSEDYVRRLGNMSKVETKQIDLRTKLYNEADIRGYTVTQRGDGSIRRAARAKVEEAV